MHLSNVQRLSMLDSKIMSIEVVYALPEQQTLISLSVPEGTSACAALELSGILQRHPDINLTTQSVGIFGEIVTLDTLVVQGDRLEIYRPLSVDPKEARRLRAKKQAKAQRLKKTTG